MFSKIFGSKQKAVKTDEPLAKDFSFLVADMHSHFIPGVDDGAQTVEDSLSLIGQMQAFGYKSLITTPHIKHDHFPNTRETIHNGLHILQQALRERGIDMPVKAAAEYYIDDHFLHLLDTEPLMTIKGNEILVELSFLFEPVKLNDIIFRIQTKGYRPILAHPERYAFYHNKLDKYKELKDRGCLLQLNAIALTGYYGRNVKYVAENMMKMKLYDYCGTDMHHIRHVENMQKLIQTGSVRKLQDYPFLNSQLHA
jgi:protein-tyrosine phosphatase